MGRWQIRGLQISGGFLGGLDMKLPPGFTCIIGPRGSGKSTLAEAIRYGLTGITNASKSRQDLIAANLGNALVTIDTSVGNNGTSAAYLVRRSYRQPALLQSADGKSVTGIDLDRGTFLPLDGYSSIEIEAIADESLGERRRALLDDLRADQLREIVAECADRRRDLEANAATIASQKQLISDLTEQIEELGQARARLHALPEPRDAGASAAFAQAVQQQQANDRELREIDQAGESIQDVNEALLGFIQQARARFSPSVAGKSSANAAIMREVEQCIASFVASLAQIAREMPLAANKCVAALRELRERLSAAHSIQRSEYNQLHEKNAVASAAIRERTLLEQSIAKLNDLEREKDAAQRQLATLKEARKAMKGDYLLARERISSLREEIAAELQREAGRKVRLRVLRNADSIAYQQLLLSGLRGARVRNHEDILAELLTLRPEELAQIIQENDCEELDRQTSMGTDRCRKILDSFRGNIDPFALEIIPIEDQIRIELNVSPGEQPNFKDAAELSRGQKCTALLPLLLARRDTPLVVDQPEDNLDNHFIYETVVECVQRLKRRRQMVFITHNANIPVLGDADLVIVLNSDGKCGFVEKSGTVEECREEIIDLLEGGREAFEMRRQRYGRGTK